MNSLTMLLLNSMNIPLWILILIIIFFVFLILILWQVFAKTHARIELFSSFRKTPLLWIDTGRDWILRTAIDNNTGILKSGKNYFIKTRNSMKPERYTGLQFGVGIIEQPYTIPTEVAVASQKSWEDGKPIFNTPFKDKNGNIITDKEGIPQIIGGIEEESKKLGFFKWKTKEVKNDNSNGVILPFDKIVYFFNSLTSGALYTLVQREVIEQIKDLKKFDWRVIIYVVLFMIGAAVVYIIIKGQGSAHPITNIIYTNVSSLTG